MNESLTLPAPVLRQCMARARKPKPPKQHLEALSEGALAALEDMRAALSAPLVLEPTPRTAADASYSVTCGSVYRSFQRDRDAGIGQLVQWGLARMCDGIGAQYAITRDGLAYTGGYRWIED